MTRLAIVVAALAALLPSAGAAGAARFDMLAATWAGGGTVAFRTHVPHGSWSPWREADNGDLAWTGAADGVQLRRHGEVRALRVFREWSPVRGVPARTLSEAGSPAIVTRAAWAANEEEVRAKPSFAPTIKVAVVHHTAGTNSYTRAQAAAIVRGIEDFHVRGNGWNDIGYNFLVDRFGTVYEGRAGGIERNVVGAHAEGFNTGTVGVALIGNFTKATPPKAMRDALVKLLAWRLDVAHLDPRSTAVVTSGGNAKFRAGRLVTLRAISGHRDTGPSECPGAIAYRLLPAVAKQVATTGLPKLYAPVVAGALGGPVRFQARLSSSLPWAVVVTDATGKVVARGSGRSALVDWTWASPAAAARAGYRWTVTAPGIRIASGTIGRQAAAPPAPLSLTGLQLAPSTIAPGADGALPSASFSFALGAPARVVAAVVDQLGATVLTVLDAQRPRGSASFQWDPSPLPAGAYSFVVTATAGAKTARKSMPLGVVRSAGAFGATPATFTPNADGVDDTTTFAFTLFAPAHVLLAVGTTTVFEGDLQPGLVSVAWDGGGLPAGVYDATLSIGGAVLSTPVTIG
jgi:N-acetylmuramoyl-L-alanine amidase-like protein/flagellar hook capping protein FlgD